MHRGSGSRVKACTECRQQKLRCDASQDPSSPCSRCKKKGIQCIVSAKFTRTKRQSKSELRAELDALRQQRVPYHYTETPASFSDPVDFPALIQQPDSTERSAPKTSDGVKTPEHTVPRALQDVHASATAINDCFAIFHAKYSPQLPVIEGQLSPNHCYKQSQFLFWTIVAIGSRKYAQNPTLISLLAPEVNNLAKVAAFSRERALHTIQALLLLCTWPMPFESLSKDITPMLSGVMLQHAVSVGLHIFGVGQDFSRTKVPKDRAQMYFRARLWALCIVVCQRVSCTDGVPPVFIPDNYDHDYCRTQTVYALPAAIRFQKTLSRMLTESVLELERYALSKVPEHRAAILNPIIDAAMTSLAQLEGECPAEIDRYYLICAQLQILTFHLFAPSSALEDSRLTEMYLLACSAVEIIENLDRTLSYADHAPYGAIRYLYLATFTILKLSRSHLRTTIDLTRGQNVYFAAIQLTKRLSIQAGDVASRSTTILTQLWTSKNVFKRADGTFDPLSLRCGSRLAMSVVFDLYWWWRQEFAGLQNPYEEKDTGQRSAAQLTGNSSDGLTPQIDSSPQSMDWAWQDSFPEFAWATAQDLLSINFPTSSGVTPNLMPNLSNTWL